jgi:TolA-binding protein
MKKTLAVCVMLCVTALVFAQQGDRELFTEAERRFESEDYELALDRYETLIREYPLSRYVPDAQFRRAVSLYRVGRPDQALELLDLVERRYRSTRYVGYVPFWRGVVLYEKGDYAAALDAFREFIGEGPQGVSEEAAGSLDPQLVNRALLYKALAEIELDDEAAAADSLQRLLADEAAPTDQPYALTLLLSLVVRSGEFESAQSLIDSIDTRALPPAFAPQVSLYAAETLRGLGDDLQAIARYRALVTSSPEVVTVAYQRLFQYAQDGEIPESPSDILRQAERALAGQTGILKELWLRVGIDTFNQGQFDLAELYFRRIWDFRATEFIPASVPLYLSRLLDRRGDIEAAVEVLREYLSIYGDESEERLRVLIALGNLQIRTSQFSEAVINLQTAVTDYPDSEYFGEAAYQYAFALERSGRTADALRTIDAAFSSGQTGGIQADLLRLRARLLREQGRNEQALQALFEYLPLRPGDAGAALEYVKLLFELERYDRVVDEAPVILDELTSRGSATTQEQTELYYVLGLSHVARKEYSQAHIALDAALRLPASESASVVVLRPYAQYYRGWASYRMGDYADAVRDFDALAAAHPEHPLTPRASYLSGWASFRMNRFSDAIAALARIRSYDADQQLTIEASYLLGRALASSGSLQQAAAEFRSLYLDYPESEFADDAWFEYGQTQAALDNVDAAVAAFDELNRSYPQSDLAEDATFRKAELYFGDQRYREARDAFFAYRTEYPSGAQIDAALYWGGQASARLGENAGAILLWERLIAENRGSPYRADAMQEAAALHVERGEYRQALNLYTELLAAYPETARAVGAQRRIDELVLLISGLTQREAELYVTIENSGGARSEDGRQAIIELAQIAIYEETAAGTDVTAVIPLLEQVAQQEIAAPAAASQALFLLGEYYSREAEFVRAAERYLEAAAASSSDRDLAALSIYRAAEMYSSAGRRREALTLVERLEEEFPGSQWLEEARDLLGGDR